MKQRLMRHALALLLVQWASMSTLAAAPLPAIKLGEMALFDMATVGDRLCAVGERGVILWSEDGGTSWHGGLAPTTRTLVSASFADSSIGFAVGQGGTLLRTDDGGKSWSRIEVAEAGQDAILGVLPLSGGEVIAYGAYGMYLESTDMGKTWSRRQILGDSFDRHIARIIAADAGRLLLVAESGTIALSDDRGATWRQVDSPYEGSYFGALATPDGGLLIFGMRGNVYRSADRGETWTKVPFASKAALNGGSVTPDGRVVVVGNSGVLAVSHDYGKSFSQVTAPERRPLAQAKYVSADEIVYVGYMATGRIRVAP